MQSQAKNYLGSGLSFPLRTNSRGEIALVSNSEDVEQAVRIILNTRQGERVMRPTFGCRAHELLFEPYSPSTTSLMQEYVLEALRMWEPRIEVTSVTILNESGSSNVMQVEIVYQIKATHDTRSIIHPFYLANEQEIV